MFYVLLRVNIKNLNIYTIAAIIFKGDIIFALVQYQMISLLHCYFSEANFAIESLFLTFLFFFFFRLKLLKSESVKLQLTFRTGMTSFSTRRQMKMTSLELTSQINYFAI